MPSLRRAGWYIPFVSHVTWQPPHRARLALLAGAIIAASVLTLTAFSLWHERREELRHAQRNLVILGHALAEHVAQRFENIDLALKAALSQVHDRALQGSGTVPDARVLHAHAEALSTVAAIGVYGAQGERLAGSTPDADVLPASIANTESFATHRTGRSQGLHIGAPARGARNGPWRMILSRPVFDAHGEFRGVIAAMLDPHTLAETYRSIDLGNDATVALVDRTGMLLAAYPWREELVGQASVDNSMLHAPSADASADVALWTSPFDKRQVLLSTAPLREFPLALAVMSDRRSALAGWRRSAVVSGAAALLTAVLALVLGALLDRNLRRREESMSQLRENQAELTEAHRIARLGSWRIDPATRTIQWSDQAALLLGTSAQHLPTLEHLLERVFDEDRPRVERAWTDLVATGTLDVEFRTTPALGAVRWLRARAEAPGHDGAPASRVRGTLLDVTDERRAQQAVQHLAAIVESTDDAIISISADGRIVSWNRGASRMFRYHADEVIGRRLDELLSPRKGAEAIRLVARSAQGETIEGFETRVALKDGSAMHISVTLSPLRDPSGRMTAASAVARDITARREGELRRQMEHRIAQLLAESAPLAVAMPRILETLCRSLALDCGIQWDMEAGAPEHRLACLWCRPDWDLAQISSQLTSRTPAPSGAEPTWHPSVPQWIGAAELQSRQPRLGACGKAFADALLIPVITGASKVVYVLELLSTRARYHDVELLASARLIGSQLGQFVERKRVEAAQQQADERLRNIAANIPGIVFEYRLRPDATAAFEFVSERSVDMLEERPETLMRDPRAMFRLVEPGYRRQLLRSMRVSRHSRSLWLSEMPIRTRSGRVRWVRGQSMPKYLDDGSVVWHGVIVDVTAQKQAEQAIQQMNEQLERRVTERTAQLSAANRELESFAYSVSHDLRAPLRSIDGFSRILTEEYGRTLEPTAADYLTRVRKASQRMGQLIDDLLSLSRVTRSELKRVRTDLSAIAEAIVQELSTDSPERKIDISIHPGMFCLADPSLIRIALYNLLGNAWKFTSKRARASIEFGALTQRSKTVYYVRDNGAGFDMGHAGKLFGAFQRLHSSRDFEGTGVGLATVSRIVDRHGGTVWAESVLDNGATFYFTLTSGGSRS